MSLREPWKAGTPDIPASAASFTIHGSTIIAAPAALVFRTLRNTDTWRDWNRFVPRVSITFQPPENEDTVTQAEIRELVKNTSIAGSIDSDITDGAAPGTHGLTGRNMSTQEEDDFRLAPPPVTTTALRRASAASGMSGVSVGSGPRTVERTTSGSRPVTAEKRRSTEAHVNGGQRLSAAQKYEAEQNRRASLAAGETPQFGNNVLVEAPGDPSKLIPAPPTDAAKEAEKEQTHSRRPSAVNIHPAAKRMMSINALYGEPSVRLTVGTKMTFHCRMKIPTVMSQMQETAMVVTEVSRPDEEGESALVRTQTHTLSRSGVYRIVWSMSTSYSPPKSFPKFLLQAQRVHEIRPVKRGDGKEECVYDNWECQRGMLAGQVKKRHHQYLQERAEEWGKGLGAYCEAMGGAVERRDFSVSY
jgi:uncharacterized protein YndB with AHSA1/START domain